MNQGKRTERGRELVVEGEGELVVVRALPRDHRDLRPRTGTGILRAANLIGPGPGPRRRRERVDHDVGCLRVRMEVELLDPPPTRPRSAAAALHLREAKCDCERGDRFAQPNTGSDSSKQQRCGGWLRMGLRVCGLRPEDGIAAPPCAMSFPCRARTRPSRPPANTHTHPESQNIQSVRQQIARGQERKDRMGASERRGADWQSRDGG
eukprot:2281101-Rhodomonas_salina.1